MGADFSPDGDRLVLLKDPINDYHKCLFLVNFSFQRFLLVVCYSTCSLE